MWRGTAAEAAAYERARPMNRPGRVGASCMKGFDLEGPRFVPHLTSHIPKFESQDLKSKI